MEDAWLRWPIRLAVACYLVRVLGDLHRSRRQRDADEPLQSRPRGGLPVRWRVLWTVGWVAYLVHVWAAFEFVHHWSHAAAFQQTAEQTAAVVGWNRGEGIWFNYAFTLLWTVDICRQWLCPLRSTCRLVWHPVVESCWQGLLALIVFNATVVFGPTYWWLVAVVFAGVSAWILLCKRERTAGPTSA